MHPWIVVHHRADDGARVRLGIRREGFEVHWPRWIQRVARKDDVLRPLFPGYMFVQADPARDRWGLIRTVPNVIGIVGVRQIGRPVLAPPGEVERLIRKAGGAIDGAIDMTPDALPANRLRPGDPVRISAEASEEESPLLRTMSERGLFGSYLRDRGPDRVEVLLSFMGVSASVVVGRAHVAPPDPAG